MLSAAKFTPVKWAIRLQTLSAPNEMHPRENIISEDYLVPQGMKV